jgi:hypothetical protein
MARKKIKGGRKRVEVVGDKAKQDKFLLGTILPEAAEQAM